jgi:hypothetical protein
MSAIPTHAVPPIVLVPITDLVEHPLLRGMPMLPKTSPEFAHLVASVTSRGLDEEPLKAVRQDDGPWLLIDGRHRRRAAESAGLDEVPVIECQASDAEAIVLAALLARRHLAKGALAYLSFPVIAARRFANGGDRKAQSTESTVLDDLARQLGFSRDLFFQARNLHEVFEKRPDLRDEYEPRIMAGEMGLGACLAGIAGRVATEGKNRNHTSKGDLLRQSFKQLEIRFTYWAEMADQERRALANEFASVAVTAPDDVKSILRRALAATGAEA